MSGFVYAIGDGEGRVKIGWSADPFRRLTKLRSDCSANAELMGVIPATKAQETEAHRLLFRWNIHGDWFWREGAVEAFVALLPKPQPRIVQWGGKDNGRPLRQWLIASNKQQKQLAAEVGCSQAMLSQIIKGERTPSLRLAKRISQATGGMVPIDALVIEKRAAE